VGKELLDKDAFYKWSLLSEDFHSLFTTWENSSYNRKLTPSIDRIDSTKGYFLDNMRWITHSENSKYGSLSQKRNKFLISSDKDDTLNNN
jgi:hypothetical protein